MLKVKDGFLKDFLSQMLHTHCYFKSTAYSILLYTVGLGVDRICITYLSRDSYLIFLVHLFHHINLKIVAGMNLVEITREYLTNAQLRVISNVKSHFPPFNELVFGGVLGQDGRLSRLSEAGTSNHNIFTMFFWRFKWARGFGV